MTAKNYFISFVCLFFLFTPSVHANEEGDKELASDKAPAASAAPAAPTTASPEKAKMDPEGEKLWAHMAELFEASKLVNSPKPEEKKQARAKLEGAIDWDRIAKECLGAKVWAKQSAKNLASYKALLKEVMLKTAYSRMTKFWEGATYAPSKVDIKGNNAVVSARFDAKGDVLALDYFMQKRGKWLIHDISYEDLRYSVNINEQIDAFLKEKPFPAFLEKLKKRSAELDSDAKKS